MVIFSEEESTALSTIAVDQALSRLSPYHRFLAFMALKGHKQVELAEMFGTSPQSINNTLQKMRKKLGVVLDI